MCETKALNQYFKQIEEIEGKAKQFKEYVNNLEIQIEEREQHLSSLRSQMKRINESSEQIQSSKIPKSVTDLILIESQNKILCNQIEIFEQKILDLKQKVSEINENRKQRINELSEESFNYCLDYGPNGQIQDQCKELRKTLKTLEEERNQLNNKNEDLVPKEFETILTESNSLNDKIEKLRAKKECLQNENYELKVIQNRDQTKLKLKENECKELIDLKKESQKLKDEENTETNVNSIKSEFPVIQISDSNEENWDTIEQKPVVSKELTEKRPQNDLEVTPNKRIHLKKVILKRDFSNNTDNKKIWELLRQRNLRRKSNN